MSSRILLTTFLVLFFRKMTDIFVKEQKRLILEAPTARREVDQAVVKLYFSGLETRLLKKRKVSQSKSIPTVSEPQPSTVLPLKGFRPSSPKKMKTLMSDKVCRAD